MNNDTSKIIYTNEKCQGCNRCISVCPVLTANCSVQSGQHQHIDVHSENCIACGACFYACEHNARDFYDDTEQFFSDLKNGEKISVLIAPSFQANYPDEYASVLGALKALGANHLISVSFGADITTWGYLNYISENDTTGMISQPCPAVVNYIERYIPELTEKLMPVQSPLMCTAIYAKKYMKISDKLAFISPCIAKKSEISDPKNHGYVSYNITFNHLMKYIRQNHITGKDASDEIEYGLGSVYPMPGGLKENVYWFCGDDVFIRQVEGQKHAYSFLKNYKDRIDKGNSLPLMVDILNCDKGCIYGTGIEYIKSLSDDNFYNLHDIKERCRKNNDSSPFSEKLSPRERLELLNKSFSMLDLKDFIREYTDKSNTVSFSEPNEEELDEIFLRMKKGTPEKRVVNCGACGYGNCRTMAIAIYNSSNVPENCIHFMKDEIHEFSEKLGEQNRDIMLKNEKLRKVIQQEEASELFIDQMIHAFAKSIDLKDEYTRGHSIRVALYVHKLAIEMGKTEAEAKEYYRIALLHDIGKLIVPKSILNKPGRLSDEEYEIIKMHSKNGYEILKEIDAFPELALGAGYHHERLDGRGYPNGITADEIPLIAKIIAVADTFDAMNSTRAYRQRMPMDKIISEMQRSSGTQLDPTITDTLIKLVNEGKMELDEEYL